VSIRHGAFTRTFAPGLIILQLSFPYKKKTFFYGSMAGNDAGLFERAEKII
jgi:hypothetical protein